jgi:hypothetical protein
MKRLRPADWLAAAGGGALIVSLFLDWYGTTNREASVNAWEAFSVVDVVLVLTGALALALAAAQATRSSPALPVAIGVLTAAAGIAATVLVLYRLANQPGPNEFIEVELGAWIGLAAVLCVAVGGWLSMADERSPHAPPVDVPVRPAPPR